MPGYKIKLSGVGGPGCEVLRNGKAMNDVLAVTVHSRVGERTIITLQLAPSWVEIEADDPALVLTTALSGMPDAAPIRREMRENVVAALNAS